MSFYYTLEFYKVYIHSKKRLNDMFRSLIVNSYYKLLSLSIRNEFVKKKNHLPTGKHPLNFHLPDWKNH